MTSNVTLRYNLLIREDKNVQRKIKQGKVKLFGHVVCRNFLLKHGIEGKMERLRRREGEEEQVSNYCVNLRKRESTGIFWR